MYWKNMHLLFGTSGESKTDSLLAVAKASTGTKVALQEVTSALPLIVADGLLVRYPWHSVYFLSLVIDMAVFQNMEELDKNNCAAIYPPLG